MNLTQALYQAQLVGLERLDAQLLLLHALGRQPQERAWLLAHDLDALAATQQAAFDHAVHRRSVGDPLAYITGYKAFYGLNLSVDPRVLVPRPDTETLVDWALALLHGRSATRVIDLGTGSGAIALALKHARPDLAVSAVDYSHDALAVAQAKAERLKLHVRFNQGSWLSDIPGRFDLLAANPPYIVEGDPHLPALAHEPLQALTSGPDGLDDIRLIVTQAPAHMMDGAWLLLEHGYDQAQAVRTLLTQAGLEQVQSRQDLNGIERCSGGRMPDAANAN